MNNDQTPNKKLRFVLVDWKDSCLGPGERTSSEMPEVARITTVGIVVRERLYDFTIARDYHAPECGEEPAWRDCVTIPKVCITRIQPLDFKED